MQYDYDLLVVGSGPGGQAAASAAAQLGQRVALIERKPYLGGVSLQTGTIPSKALREAAYLTSRAAGLGMRGALQRRAATEPGFLAAALRQKDRVVESKEAQMLGRLMEEGVTLIPGEAGFVDAHTLAVVSPKGDVQPLSAAIIVLATGSRPRRPADVPFDKERVLDSTSILKIRRLPGSLIVVGGGVIACEFATMFAALGTRVTLVDSHAQPLAYLDADIQAELAGELHESGIELRMNTRVAGIAPTDVGTGVTLTTQDGEVLEADALLYALGREPNYDGLRLERAGLLADDQGWVRINEHQQTAQSHIYIVGDLAGRPSLASTAMEQGRRAAHHAFGGAASSDGGILPMAIYTIPEVSWVGETEAELQARDAHYVSGSARYCDTARGQIIGAEHGLLKLLVDRDSRAILGVHILGESASELVHVGQMAMACGAGVDRLAATVFNYPTLAQCYKTAALDCMAQLEA
ncbi:MAG: Si-specific NAD(P)(+) transhydrogenase [Xanthomonadaceae bacterium]|nr:Si-specific NAD(P)(+) transhydrogenase [Xanthomonadaceae bacterium]